MADGISYGDGNIDLHNNLIHENTDDFFEPDFAWYNYRIWDNLAWDGGNSGVSFQPMNGGPWYIFRNPITGVKGGSLKLTAGAGPKFIIGKTIVAAHAIQGIEDLFERGSVFASNFWRVDSASGYDHVGSGTMPDPVETLLWDYNRYDVLAEKAFDLSGYQALGELMSLGVEPHSSLVNADFFETAEG